MTDEQIKGTVLAECERLKGKTDGVVFVTQNNALWEIQSLSHNVLCNFAESGVPQMLCWALAYRLLGLESQKPAKDARSIVEAVKPKWFDLEFGLCDRVDVVNAILDYVGNPKAPAPRGDLPRFELRYVEGSTYLCDKWAGGVISNKPEFLGAICKMPETPPCLELLEKMVRVLNAHEAYFVGPSNDDHANAVARLDALIGMFESLARGDIDRELIEIRNLLGGQDNG